MPPRGQAVLGGDVRIVEVLEQGIGPTQDQVQGYFLGVAPGQRRPAGPQVVGEVADRRGPSPGATRRSGCRIPAAATRGTRRPSRRRRSHTTELQMRERRSCVIRLGVGVLARNLSIYDPVSGWRSAGCPLPGPWCPTIVPEVHSRSRSTVDGARLASTLAATTLVRESPTQHVTRAVRVATIAVGIPTGTTPPGRAAWSLRNPRAEGPAGRARFGSRPPDGAVLLGDHADQDLHCSTERPGGLPLHPTARVNAFRGRASWDVRSQVATI